MSKELPWTAWPASARKTLMQARAALTGPVANGVARQCAVTAIDETVAALAPAAAAPIDMVLHCPTCGVQHIDAPEPSRKVLSGNADHFVPPAYSAAWDNPPHRSHLCHGCGCIWRPADVPTNGVERVQTRGQADTWP